jgi:hypothetical protein
MASEALELGDGVAEGGPRKLGSSTPMTTRPPKASSYYEFRFGTSSLT